MGQLRLLEPGEEYAEQIMEYRRAFLSAGEPLVGCGGLEEAESYQAWIHRLRRCDGEGIPSLVYLALRKADRRIVGMVELHQFQTASLRRRLGDIRCSILPGERGKGCGSEMLEKMLGVCWRLGGDERILACDRADPAATGMILHCGGQLMDEVEDVAGVGSSGYLRRYRVATHNVEEEQEDVYFDWFAQHWADDPWKHRKDKG